MTVNLLPEGFDQALEGAVQTFWSTRTAGGGTQQGGRGNVIGGKNLDGFLGVVEAVAIHCGLPITAIHTRGRGQLTIPGYFRPTKNWDVLIVHQQHLLAALEFKSQVGSLGNNFNNRAEEALGSATDFVAAARNGIYGTPPGQVPPFLGWLMVLEDTEASNQARAARSAHFEVPPEFRDTSHAQRYRLLCEKMVAAGLYTRAGLLLTPPAATPDTSSWRALSDGSDPRALFRALAAHLSAQLG